VPRRFPHSKNQAQVERQGQRSSQSMSHVTGPRQHRNVHRTKEYVWKS
jgi:hypothetical protein